MYTHWQWKILSECPSGEPYSLSVKMDESANANQAHNDSGDDTFSSHVALDNVAVFEAAN